MMLPVSWQMGCDLFFAMAMFCSMIFIALAAMVPCFSRSSESRMALCTSSGISVEVRRMSSSSESCSTFIARRLSMSENQVKWCPHCDGLLELLDEHLGVAAALIVFLPAGGRQVIGSALGKAAFALEIGEGLRGQREEFVETHITRLVLHVMDELAADALVFVRRADVEAGELALAVLHISVQGDASDRVLVDLKDVIIAELLLDGRAGALDQLLAFHGALGEVEDAAAILLERAANLLEFVAVDERADAFVGEDLGEQPFLNGAIDDVNARHASLAGGRGVDGLGEHVRLHVVLLQREHRFQVRDGHLADDMVADADAIVRGDEHQLRGLECFGHCEGDGVGVDPVGLPLAVKAQRRQDGDYAMFEQLLEHLDVHPFDLAAEELIRSVQDRKSTRLNSSHLGISYAV